MSLVINSINMKNCYYRSLPVNWPQSVVNIIIYKMYMLQCKQTSPQRPLDPVMLKALSNAMSCTLADEVEALGKVGLYTYTMY